MWSCDPRHHADGLTKLQGLDNVEVIVSDGVYYAQLNAALELMPCIS